MSDDVTPYDTPGRHRALRLKGQECRIDIALKATAPGKFLAT